LLSACNSAPAPLNCGFPIWVPGDERAEIAAGRYPGLSNDAARTTVERRCPAPPSVGVGVGLHRVAGDRFDYTSPARHTVGQT
jgi:hypothetical protein